MKLFCIYTSFKIGPQVWNMSALISPTTRTALFPDDLIKTRHRGCYSPLEQKMTKLTSDVSQLAENNFHPFIFLYLSFLHHLSLFLSPAWRPPRFNPDHSGCDWEARRRRIPAAGGGGGLGYCHLCDHPAGTAGSFLHPQNAAQPTAHLHLPVRIGEEREGLFFFNRSSQGWHHRWSEKKPSPGLRRLFQFSFIAELHTVYPLRVRRPFCSLIQGLWRWHGGPNQRPSPSPIPSWSGRT